MTTLDDWLKEGLDVRISNQIEPDTIFAFDNLRVVHPDNYSYISNSNIFVAHEINMLRIEEKIEKMAEDALRRLDLMVYQYEHKHDSRIVLFTPGVDVVENEDGTYTFNAVASPTIDPAQVFRETKRLLTADYMKDYQ